MATERRFKVLAAIDVGSNAVRLKVAQPLPDNSLETLHEERDPVRPGEGVFTTGRLDQEVVERLLSTLRRYGALCRRYHARIRAVATSALREASMRLTEVFSSSATVTERKLALMRAFAREAFDSLPRDATLSKRALGSSGTINAVVGYAGRDGKGATREEVARAAEELAAMSVHERRHRFDARRAEIIVAGAVILDCAMHHFRLSTVQAVNRGLRDGILVDLLRRNRETGGDESLADGALTMARRFGIDCRHAEKVARLALDLFDRTRSVHRLPPPARPLLEVAALLHDIGSAISPQAHHKHSCYLIQNADLPVLSTRERDICARIARFHRRSAPDRAHAGMKGLTVRETMMVRKLATLLRIADALDRSHHQPVRSMAVSAGRRAVSIQLRHRAAVDLELWDVEREAVLFHRVFGRRLDVQGKNGERGRSRRSR
ncbi:MAG: HD domain-containing protein [Deltaproteobacteria bacterium]|nr:MAG: HD domain-containing protein [Deltaproteobacteria bacterium]